MNEHVLDLIPGYVLDSLEEPEMMSVAAHIGKCELCQAELRAYQQVADQLALAAPAAQPPPQVKERLMKRVDGGAKKIEAEPSQALPAGVSWLQRLFGWLRQPVGMAALLVAVVALAAAVFLYQNNRTSAPALKVVNMTGTTDAPNAIGLLVLSEDGEYGTLVVDHMPVLPADRQYQLWLVKDGQRTSGGVFSASQEGYASLWVVAPQPLNSYSSFGITVEPQGGSPGPTGKKVLGGSMKINQY